MGKVDNNKTWDKACDPLICLYFDKIINPITVVHVTEPFVFHRTIAVDKGLKGIGEIVLITEVKIFASKHFLKSLQINLIFACFFMTQTEELHFLCLKYFSMINLANYRRLGHNYQVVVYLHFHNTINCLNRYFLIIEYKILL